MQPWATSRSVLSFYHALWHIFLSLLAVDEQTVDEEPTSDVEGSSGGGQGVVGWAVSTASSTVRGVARRAGTAANTAGGIASRAGKPVDAL